MSASTPADPVQSFVEEVLRTGVMLTDVLGALLDDLPEDAFPGEQPGEVLVEMLVGTVRPAVEAVAPRTLTEATALLGRHERPLRGRPARRHGHRRAGALSSGAARRVAVGHRRAAGPALERAREVQLVLVADAEGDLADGQVGEAQQSLGSSITRSVMWSFVERPVTCESARESAAPARPARSA